MTVIPRYQRLGILRNDTAISHTAFRIARLRDKYSSNSDNIAVES